MGDGRGVYQCATRGPAGGHGEHRAEHSSPFIFLFVRAPGAWLLPTPTFGHATWRLGMRALRARRGPEPLACGIRRARCSLHAAGARSPGRREIHARRTWPQCRPEPRASARALLACSSCLLSMSLAASTAPPGVTGTGRHTVLPARIATVLRAPSARRWSHPDGTRRCLPTRPSRVRSGRHRRPRPRRLHRRRGPTARRRRRECRQRRRRHRQRTRCFRRAPPSRLAPLRASTST